MHFYNFLFIHNMKKKTHELYSFNEKVRNISKTYVFRQIGLQSYPKMYFAEP